MDPCLDLYMGGCRDRDHCSYDHSMEGLLRFKRELCDRGDRCDDPMCIHLHSEGENQYWQSRFQPNLQVFPNAEKVPCYDYAVTNCYNPYCPYGHSDQIMGKFKTRFCHHGIKCNRPKCGYAHSEGEREYWQRRMFGINEPFYVDTEPYTPTRYYDEPVQDNSPVVRSVTVTRSFDDASQASRTSRTSREKDKNDERVEKFLQTLSEMFAEKRHARRSHSKDRGRRRRSRSRDRSSGKRRRSRSRSRSRTRKHRSRKHRRSRSRSRDRDRSQSN